MWRQRLEEAADEVLSAPEIARVVDRALAGSLPEELARSLVRHRVIERIAAELAKNGELERLVTAALASPQTLELSDARSRTAAADRRRGDHRPRAPPPRAAVGRRHELHAGPRT
jgi:hypothetical protein